MRLRNLRIGSIGDVPLRATTMAINFNMVAFIPLVGVSIAASVLVGRHLLESGPQRAVKSVYAGLLIGSRSLIVLYQLCHKIQQDLSIFLKYIYL